MQVLAIAVTSLKVFVAAITFETVLIAEIALRP
jgi:hypothetical protein